MSGTPAEPSTIEPMADADTPTSLPGTDGPAGDELVADVIQLEDLLGDIYLYINWRYVTKQLTSDQKERFAQAVEAWSARLNEGSDEAPFVADRWWAEHE